mmetsp:Transcript_5867/g.12862  ORF Transcript_5867/g.12862 Transcript_5867/m.12862 type:complete len:257 (+) Transcript_5867:93-863(+)
MHHDSRLPKRGSVLRVAPIWKTSHYCRYGASSCFARQSTLPTSSMPSPCCMQTPTCPRLRTAVGCTATSSLSTASDAGFGTAWPMDCTRWTIWRCCHPPTPPAAAGQSSSMCVMECSLSPLTRRRRKLRCAPVIVSAIGTSTAQARMVSVCTSFGSWLTRNRAQNSARCQTLSSRHLPRPSKTTPCAILVCCLALPLRSACRTPTDLRLARLPSSHASEGCSTTRLSLRKWDVYRPWIPGMPSSFCQTCCIAHKTC